MCKAKNFSMLMANMAFVCAILVVFIHAVAGFSPAENSLGWWIVELFPNGLCRIAVPFFFFASGYFLAAHVDECGWWRNAVRKRVQTLVIPFFVWNVFYWIYGYVIRLLFNVISGKVMLKSLSVDLGRLIGYNMMAAPISTPLWFLRALVIYVFFSAAIVFVLRSNRLARGLFMSGVAVAYLLISPWRVPEGWRCFFRFGISLEGLFYFSVGIWSKLNHVKFNIEGTRKYILAGGVLILGICCFKLRVVSEDAIRQGLFHAGGVMLSLLGVALTMPCSNFLGPVVFTAFPMYLLHCAFLFPVGRGFNMLVCDDVYHASTLIFFSKGVIAACLSICVTMVMRKYLPLVARFLFGGR